MKYRKGLIFMLIILAGLIVFVAVELLIVAFNGKPTLAPVITQEPIVMGKGSPLTYVLLGDSTAVAQGGDYDTGIAVSTAQHLAKYHTLKFVNLAVSGARMHDVAYKQLASALQYKPDVVLVDAGANDVMHLTNPKHVKSALEHITKQLVGVNCNVKIIVTGSADMGSIPRFPQPIRWLAGVRTKVVNKAVQQVVDEQGLTLAPIAEKTGPIFRKQPKLFAVDKFHPTKMGYDVWTPVLNDAISNAISDQRPHCE